MNTSSLAPVSLSFPPPPPCPDSDEAEETFYTLPPGGDRALVWQRNSAPESVLKSEDIFNDMLNYLENINPLSKSEDLKHRATEKFATGSAELMIDLCPIVSEETETDRPTCASDGCATARSVVSAAPTDGVTGSTSDGSARTTRSLLDTLHRRFYGYQDSYLQARRSETFPRYSPVSRGNGNNLAWSLKRTRGRHRTTPIVWGTDVRERAEVRVGVEVREDAEVREGVYEIGTPETDTTKHASCKDAALTGPAKECPSELNGSSSELEALEACRWLRAAGFPQYARMYEDSQFPIEVEAASRDHDFLDGDSMKSLFRRLYTLNECTEMKIHTPARSLGGESDDDDEDECALSDRWRFQRNSQRWSRKDISGIDADTTNASPAESFQSFVQSCSSQDSVLTDSSPVETSPELDTRKPHPPIVRPQCLDIENRTGLDKFGSFGADIFTDYSNKTPCNTNVEEDVRISSLSPRLLRRAASVRLKEAKNNFMKKVDTLRHRKGKSASIRRPAVRGAAGTIKISSPTLVDSSDMQARMERLGCVDISPTADVTRTAVSADERSRDSRLSTGSQDTLTPDAADKEGKTNSFYTSLQHQPGTFPAMLLRDQESYKTLNSDYALFESVDANDMLKKKKVPTATLR